MNASRTVADARIGASRHYVFRTTTEQLQQHLDHIRESGDDVLTVQFVGGRDWVIIGIKDRHEVSRG